MKTMAGFLRASKPRLKTVQDRKSCDGRRSRLSTAVLSASGPWFNGSLISVRRSIAGPLAKQRHKRKAGTNMKFAPWTVPGDDAAMKRILAVHAHPDDIEFLCAGTLALLSD